MKELWKNKTQLKIILGVAALILIPVAFFLGIRYVAPVVMIALIYYFVHNVKYDNIISPDEFAEMKAYLRDLEEQAAMIEEHLTEYEGDLSAKFELREINKEIELIKKEMGL